MDTVTKINKDKSYIRKASRRRAVPLMKLAAHRAARRAGRTSLHQGNWDTREAPRMTGWDVC